MNFETTLVVTTLRVVVLGITLSAALPADSEDLGLYLSRLSAEPSRPAGDATLANNISLTLHHRDPSLLESALRHSGLSVVEAGDDYIKVISPTEARLLYPPTSLDRDPSFVVDFAEPALVELKDAVIHAYGAAPAIDDLMQFVYSTIELKTYNRGFDIASSIAITKEGDCTEHAVLLTALARSLGRPARIVFGLILLRQQENIEAAGHAWTEIFDNDEWVRVDATRPELSLPETDFHYLPLSMLADEGLGFGMSLFQAYEIFPQRISEIAAAES